MLEMHYLVSAWAGVVRDEHQLLGDVLACLLQTTVLPAAHLPIPLPSPVQLTIEPYESSRAKDVWATVGGAIKPSFELVVTSAVDDPAFAELAPRVERINALVAPVPPGPPPGRSTGLSTARSTLPADTSRPAGLSGARLRRFHSRRSRPGLVHGRRRRCGEHGVADRRGHRPGDRPAGAAGDHPSAGAGAVPRVGRPAHPEPGTAVGVPRRAASADRGGVLPAGGRAHRVRRPGPGGAHPPGLSADGPPGGGPGAPHGTVRADRDQLRQRPAGGRPGRGRPGAGGQPEGDAGAVAARRRSQRRRAHRGPWSPDDLRVGGRPAGHGDGHRGAGGRGRPADGRRDRADRRTRAGRRSPGTRSPCSIPAANSASRRCRRRASCRSCGSGPGSPGAC